MEDVVASYGGKLFYDAEPDPEYMMARIWADIVMQARVQARDRDDKGHILVPLKITSVTDELQKAHGSRGREHREVEYPKQTWVKRALDGLVQLRYARKVDDDNYVVLYRQIRGDLIDTFVRGRARTEKTSRKRAGRKPSRDTRTMDMFGS